MADRLNIIQNGLMIKQWMQHLLSLSQMPQNERSYQPDMMPSTTSFLPSFQVAEHINEMQRIHEEYGAIFDHLFRQHQKAASKQVGSSVSLSLIETIWTLSES